MKPWPVSTTRQQDKIDPFIWVDSCASDIESPNYVARIRRLNGIFGWRLTNTWRASFRWAETWITLCKPHPSKIEVKFKISRPISRKDGDGKLMISINRVTKEESQLPIGQANNRSEWISSLDYSRDTLACPVVSYLQRWFASIISRRPNIWSNRPEIHHGWQVWKLVIRWWGKYN